jgi:HD-GYP domain-containing protein (c-di-GMP phosphodiesterase class II)
MSKNRPADVRLITRQVGNGGNTAEELRKTNEKLLKILNATIQAMVRTVEVRDPYTAGHQRRVTDLACAIGVEMGLSDDKMDAIRTAGSIHDLGMISVPAEILSKTGKLTEIEFGMIKSHPHVGYEILKEIDFPWDVARIVLQHHERTDGSGYPQGLKGQNILLEARIIGLADVVEAMASHRPYRPALGIDKALEEISRNRGILYDLEAGDACLSTFRHKVFRFKE